MRSLTFRVPLEPPCALQYFVWKRWVIFPDKGSCENRRREAYHTTDWDLILTVFSSNPSSLVIQVRVGICLQMVCDRQSRIHIKWQTLCFSEKKQETCPCNPNLIKPYLLLRCHAFSYFLLTNFLTKSLEC